MNDINLTKVETQLPFPGSFRFLWTMLFTTWFMEMPLLYWGLFPLPTDYPALLRRRVHYLWTFCSNTRQMKVNLENKIFSIKVDSYGWGINLSWFVCFPSQVMWRSQGLPDFAYLYLRKIVCLHMNINKKQFSRVMPVVCNDEVNRPSILLDLFAYHLRLGFSI